MSQYVVFRLGEQRYGIHIGQVQSIETMRPITRLPGTRAYVKGLMNLRGVVVPVIDPKIYFGLDEHGSNEDTRIIVVSSADVVVGLVVDEANDVVEISDDSVQPPETMGDIAADYLLGIAILDSGIVGILDLNKIINYDAYDAAGNERTGSGL